MPRFDEVASATLAKPSTPSRWRILKAFEAIARTTLQNRFCQGIVENDFDEGFNPEPFRGCLPCYAT